MESAERLATHLLEKTKMKIPLERAPLSRRKFLGISAGAFAGTNLLIKINGCSKTMTFDTIIQGAVVYDGLGNEPIDADIGINGNRIAEIGGLARHSATNRIDAKGLAIAPGFIDIHSHTDLGLLIDPRAESKIRQGVTTEVLGQDGSSVAPLKEKDRQRLHDRYMKEYGVPITWTDFSGFFQQLRENGTAVNWLTMVGQGTLRGYVVGLDDRPATEEEVTEMQRLAREYIGQGVWGISSGLEYTPGSYASTEEIIRVCSVFKDAAALYATHMRNEDDEVEQALQEAIDIATKAGVGLQVSHLKAQGRRNWHRAPTILKMIEEASKAGLKVAADRYPYEAYSTGLSSLFPLWSRDGGNERFLQRLRDKTQFAKIRIDLQNKIDRLGSWEAVMISSVHLEENKWMLGKRLPEIARQRNQDIFECTRDLILEEKNRVDMCGFGMSEENTKLILKHPLVAIDSDGSARATEGPLSEGHPHPRNFGTFPRVLGKYARDEGLFPLQEAIRKMTSLPASILGLQKRGSLVPDAFADLVVFDPEKVADRATFENPKQYPVGIHYVMVNGEFVIFQDQHNGNLPGHVLLAKKQNTA